MNNNSNAQDNLSLKKPLRVPHNTKESLNHTPSKNENEESESLDDAHGGNILDKNFD